MKKNQPGPASQPANPAAAAIASAKLRQAVAFHQQGQLGPAEALYREILQTDPRHFDALHLLGVIALQTGHAQIAHDLIGQAIAVNRQHPDAHSNMGNALKELGRLPEALASYDRALRLKPDYPEALYNRGAVLYGLQRPEEALACYDRALRLRPGYVEAHNNRGMALRALRRLEEALASFDRAVRLNPDYAEALYNRGNILQELKRPEESLASFERALRLKPGHAEAFYNRGNALLELRRPEEALASFEQALRLRPDYAEAHNSRGVALQDLQREEESLASFESALRLAPDYVEALANQGSALHALGRPQEALACYGQALRLQPELADAHWNGSLSRLLLGDFAAGWQQYEWRWKTEAFTSPQRNFAQPLWLGQGSLAGKTILLHAEQGLGDTIQFCRYAQRVAAAGATVLLEAQAALKPLLAGLEGVERILAQGEPLPAFDCHCPLMSLPLAFATGLDTIPAEIPYLRADPARVRAWQARLGGAALPRVGLAWSGGAAYKNDRRRSIPLAGFDRLASCRAQFISLQKELREADRLVLERRADIAHYGGELADFAETAALVANLDLVIAVDTAVAHLAGALGKPVWLLLPANPDWRWLLGRGDSPWYPSMRLFRQAKLGDWESVIAQVAAALDTFGPPPA